MRETASGRCLTAVQGAEAVDGLLYRTDKTGQRPAKDREVANQEQIVQPITKYSGSRAEQKHDFRKPCRGLRRPGRRPTAPPTSRDTQIFKEERVRTEIIARSGSTPSMRVRPQSRRDQRAAQAHASRRDAVMVVGDEISRPRRPPRRVKLDEMDSACRWTQRASFYANFPADASPTLRSDISPAKAISQLPELPKSSDGIINCRPTKFKRQWPATIVPRGPNS